MADRREALCASPAYKRPRLENDSNLLGLSIPNDVVMPPKEFKRQRFASDAANEVTSSSDANSEMCNGDSGFHELTSTTGGDLANADGVCPDNDNLVTAGVAREVDSSGHLFLGALGAIDMASKDDNICDDDADEVASTISELSGLSDLSDLAGAEWKPTSEENSRGMDAGPMGWVQRQMSVGADPRALLERLLPDGAVIPPSLDRLTLWKVLISMLSEEEPPRRTKLAHVNTLDDVVHLLRNCQRVLVLTGAGVSVSCGIPDFRSRNGIYARLSKDFPALPDPQAMFDIHYFRKDPRPFFKFAKEIYPGQFTPSASHRFIKRLEDNNKLLRNYTQNIDTLEQTCGIRNVITCHGSFATASCTRCHHKVDCNMIKEEIFSQRIPLCPKCSLEEVEASGEMAVMKPDIVFFGEGLSQEFHQAMSHDKTQCDLLIVMGSSLKVRPVALIPSSIPPEVPQILINRESLKHVTFDVELLGDCDVIIKELCNRLGWDVAPSDGPVAPLTELTSLPPQVSNKSSSEVKAPAEQSGTTASDENGNTPTSSTSVAEEVMPDSTSADMVPTVESQVDSLDCSPECPWKPRTRESIASRLPEGHYLFTPPSTYIFSGAEVYVDSEDSDSPGASYTGEEEEEAESDSESSRSSFSSDEDGSPAHTSGLESPSQGNTMDCDPTEQSSTTASTTPLVSNLNESIVIKARVSEEEGSSDVERNTLRCS
ncbi:NAD-dependent protein deacetylase sirtuin-1 isoform X1 [Rhipicephalus sanguineus]|uniref:NAD-dependent protein deacetylase sirtuin-1 isoform X1 n=1 Tax=Rhipicephalus sanguineus TaxID=34632 RepID=UPI0018931CAD|nr:NAD-dependent protein deacetylase sirtuin-1 isoform X1 [Rhipicephalus sanguineus]